MRGHVTRKGDVWYAVIYEGVDPVTGKEHRRWHRVGTDRDEAEEMAAHLAAAEEARRNGHRSELSVAGFLTRYWLPAKRIDLEASTFDATNGWSDSTYSAILEISRFADYAPSDSRSSTPACWTMATAAPAEDSLPRLSSTSMSSSARAWTTPSAVDCSAPTRPKPPTLPNVDGTAVGPNECGPPTSSKPSFTWLQTVASTRRSGWQPTPECDAENYSVCVGMPSTSTSGGSPSTGRSSR